MRNRVQYFSNYDMSISYYLQNAEEIIKKYHDGWRPTEVNDVIECKQSFRSGRDILKFR